MQKIITLEETISRTCVLDQYLNHRSEVIVSIIWRIDFQTKFLDVVEISAANYL